MDTKGNNNPLKDTSLKTVISGFYFFMERPAKKILMDKIFSYPFFLCFKFFSYLCGMGNANKQGYVIKDKEIKSIKKLVKDMTIITNGRGDGWRDHRGMLLGAKIKITSVRKYENKWSWNGNNKFCYEVDIEVDITDSTYMGYSGSKYSVRYDLGRGIRGTNNYYRSSLEKYVIDELKYFGIDTRSYSSLVSVSKIKYKYQ